ncbi:hypothetical protein NC651_026136 [Populus alba x Populus x berolinensis]|nr:hypothetical protein NC651_026136 [Populus alba x Populus x berolinensis]
MRLLLHVLVEVLKLPIAYVLFLKAVHNPQRLLVKRGVPIKLPTKSHGNKALRFCSAILHSSHPPLQCFFSLKNDPLRLEDDRRLLIIGLISTFKVSSHAFCLNFVSFSRLGRCGDSSSLTSQSFRASNADLYGIFLGIVYFLQNLLALSRVGGLPLLMEGFNV